MEYNFEDIDTRVVGSIGYTKDGIFPSEAIIFLAQCKKHKIDIIIESGVKHGYSTTTLGHSGCDMHSIDIIMFDTTRQKFADNEKVHLYEGDSRKIMEGIIKEHPNKNIACMIDGPKGKLAINLAKMALSYENVKFIGIHDIAREFSEDRITTINNTFPDKEIFITSDHKQMRIDEGFNELDAKIVPQIDMRIFKRFPNGPGFGFIFN